MKLFETKDLPKQTLQDRRKNFEDFSNVDAQKKMKELKQHPPRIETSKHEGDKVFTVMKWGDISAKYVKLAAFTSIDKALNIKDEAMKPHQAQIKVYKKAIKEYMRKL